MLAVAHSVQVQLEQEETHSLISVRLFCVYRNPLGTNEAATILENVPEEQVSTLPPVKPKGRELYIYWNSKAGQANK